MEGYLLAFPKNNVAELRYCVLESGSIKFFDDRGGALVETIELTRHRITVKPLDCDTICPNRFIVSALALKRNDHVGAFVAEKKSKKVHVFAAASFQSMRKWCNTIHNWRRHWFDDPTRDMALEDHAIRAHAIDQERTNLVSLANRFDIHIASSPKLRGGFFKARSDATLLKKTESGLVSIHPSRAGVLKSRWLSALLPSALSSISSKARTGAL